MTRFAIRLADCGFVPDFIISEDALHFVEYREQPHASLRALGLTVLGSVSAITFPTRRRRQRIQVAAFCACTTMLILAYGVLVTISANIYRIKIM